MPETFAKPSAGAIIEKTQQGERYILVQQRNKVDGGAENGMLELPAGKIREYENIFDTLRREVREETGLEVSYIQGEESATAFHTKGYETISFLPFCVTQNLSGGYSIILHTFLCRAEGELQIETDEAINIRWELARTVKQMLLENPEQFFPMHINALHKYFLEYPVK